MFRILNLFSSFFFDSQTSLGRERFAIAANYSNTTMSIFGDKDGSVRSLEGVLEFRGSFVAEAPVILRLFEGKRDGKKWNVNIERKNSGKKRRRKRREVKI